MKYSLLCAGVDVTREGPYDF